MTALTLTWISRGREALTPLNTHRMDNGFRCPQFLGYVLLHVLHRTTDTATIYLVFFLEIMYRTLCLMMRSGLYVAPY